MNKQDIDKWQDLLRLKPLELSKRLIDCNETSAVIRVESKRHKNCVNYKITKHTTEVKWWLHIGRERNVFDTKWQALMMFRSGKLGKSNIPLERYKPTISFKSPGPLG